MKLGRNDPCWCGSGMKYKRCHLDREQQKARPPGAIRHRQEKALSKKYCLHPSRGAECRGQIVKAHSVSRAGSLVGISRRGHVLRIGMQVSSPGSRPGFGVEEVGVRRASTFTGFCGHHDNELFRPIEESPFVGSKEQCFLLTYRIIAMELHLKRGMQDAYAVMREHDRGWEVDGQVELQGVVSRVLASNKKSLSEFESFMGACDEALLAGDYSGLAGVVIHFDRPAPFACSGTAYPEFDLSGNRLQAVTSTSRNELLVLHLVPTESGSAFALMWPVAPGTIAEKFAGSLTAVDRESLPEVCMRVMLSFSENVYLSPEWWESLDERARQAVLRLHRIEIDRRRTGSDFTPDGSVRFEVNVTNIEWV